MKQSASLAQETTSAYLDLVLSEMQDQYARTFSYLIQCTIQDCKYKIMVSNDGTLWEILGEITDIVKDTQHKVSGDLLFQYIKMQIIDGATPAGKIASQGLVR